MDFNDHIMCYYKSVLDLYVPAKVHPQIEGFELILGRTKYFFSKVFTPFNSATSTFIFKNKLYASFLLSKHDIPIPKTGCIYLDDYLKGDWEESIGELEFPLVIKPLETTFTEGVGCTVQSIGALTQLIDIHLPVYESLLVQEFHEDLNVYRILVFNKQIISIIQHIPNHFGEGVGGYKAIRTKICTQNKKFILRVAKLTGLGFVEINLACDDINLPIHHSKGMITEIDHNPNIKIHEIPTLGKTNRVSLKMVRSLIYRHPIAYFFGFFRHYLE